MKTQIDQCLRVLAVIPQARALNRVMTELRDMDPRIRIVGTTDPFEALALLMSDDFEVLLSSYEMPRIDGPRLVREIAGSITAPTPVLIARPDCHGVAETARELGVSDVVHTPIRMSRLHDAVMSAGSKTLRARAIGSGTHTLRPDNSRVIAPVIVKEEVEAIEVALEPLDTRCGMIGCRAVPKRTDQHHSLEELRRGANELGHPFMVLRPLLREAIVTWQMSKYADGVLAIEIEPGELFAPDFFDPDFLAWTLRHQLVIVLQVNQLEARCLRQASALQQAGFRVAISGGQITSALVGFMKPNFSLENNVLADPEQPYHWRRSLARA